MYLCRQSNFPISKFHKTMDFRTQIFEALKAKFTGGNAAVLNRIADKLAKTVTSAEQVATAVAGITQDFVDMMESYGDARATEAAQTSVRNYEATHGIKDGKPIGGGQQTQPTTVVQPANPPAGGASELSGTDKLLAQLLEQNKKLNERLDRMDGERTTASRKQQLSTVISKLPESLRKPYERMAVENLTDEQFNALVGEVTAEVDGIANEISAKGAVFSTPAVNQKGGNTKQATDAEVDAVVNMLGI